MRIIVPFLLLSILFITSCGGGSSVSPPHDLTGLMGNWEYHRDDQDVIVHATGGDVVFPTFYYDAWVIDQSRIKRPGYQDLLDWEYDGKVLKVTEPFEMGIDDAECGICSATGTIRWTIPIEYGATEATMSGVGDVSLTTESCGNGSATFNVTGSLTKD